MHIAKSSSKKVPYIREALFTGSLSQFMGDRVAFLRRIAQSYGDVCGFHVGPLPFILFCKPEHVHSILVEHADAFDKGSLMRNILRLVIGRGVFLSEGEAHRRQRKILAPAFQPRHICGYADIMVQYGEQLQQEWQDTTVIDIKQQMTNLTRNIIGTILFGSNIFFENDELVEAMSITSEYVEHALSRLFTPPLNWPTSRNRRTRKAALLVRQHVQRMIDERRQDIAHQAIEKRKLVAVPAVSVTAQEEDGVERNDYLSILLQIKDEQGHMLNDQYVMDECLTLFGAGHETTAAALTWAWYLLSLHPDIYQKVLQEVDTVLHGRTPTYADLPQLPYCLQVFKETMRIYPPAYIIARAARRTVEIDGYRVPRGAYVLLAPCVMHQNPQYFADPQEFDPERFLPDQEKQLPRYAYTPFGAGPRVCLGSHFAMMEGHLLLATLAQRVIFDLLPGQDVQPDPLHNLALWPGGSVNMSVKKR